MKDKYEGCYIDGYKDHYAVFADNGEKLAEYDTHKEAKEDIAEWEAEVKNESYIPADTLATGYRFTIHETELLENAIKKYVEQKVDQGVNGMFDTDSEEFKKVGNELYDKSQWWDDMKLTMRIKKTPYPRKNGYTNGDFRPNQKWLMGAIDCCKSARDCEYLLTDAYLSVAHDKKLIQNLKSVRDGNPNKYVNVKVVQKWLDNGVTPEKVEKHIEWFKANYIKGLQAKKKEFNKAQNETVTEEPMNEILITLAIFGTIWGLSCLYDRIVEAKNKAKLKKDIKNAKKNNPNISDRELDEIMGIIGITEKEINELARQAKALKTDITAKQKSSPLYKDLYQYMKEWNTDEYMDAVKAIKSGETVDLSLDFRTDIYYAFVEFFNQSNPNFRKQIKDLADDEAEKLEIKYEKDSFDEMKKHLVSLGFDLNKPVTNNHKQYYSSKKYPDLIIRYADGDDGTGIIIEPKCTLGATKFKLISEEEGKKKLNEDHSEISNDPEMEELMALAGVTTADLDDLENDNDLDLDDDDPIDANTLREIDAAMDESVKSAINNIELATKGMDVNIEQIEKFIPIAKDFLKYMKSAPIAYDENSGDGLKIKNDTVDFVNKCVKFDYDRGSDDELKIIGRNWIKYNLATLFDKLSFNNKKVSPAQLELYKKCVMGGEFDTRLQKCYNELKAILKEVNDFYDQLAKKLGSDFEKTVNYKMVNSFGNEYNYFWGQYCFTTGDNKSAMKYAGRTRVSLFGKRVRDSINESFLGIKSKKEKNAKELTKDEFDKLINDMVNINDAIISKLKTSKWWKFIYEPCMNIDKDHFDANILASNFKRDFSAGKLVSPSLHPKFIDIDNSDPRIYTKFDKETKKPYSNPKYEDLWEEGWTEGYYEAIKLVKDAVKKLGFNEDGKSSKYPDIEISVSDSECVAIDICPIYTGYYKLKETDKKSQNESVDIDLDILLAESAEFLFDE
nr:MAG TPA: hypothetical protein [Caudoviricetes sp.]